MRHERHEEVFILLHIAQRDGAGGGRARGVTVHTVNLLISIAFSLTRCNTNMSGGVAVHTVNLLLSDEV